MSARKTVFFHQLDSFCHGCRPPDFDHVLGHDIRRFQHSFFSITAALYFPVFWGRNGFY